MRFQKQALSAILCENKPKKMRTTERGKKQSVKIPWSGSRTKKSVSASEKDRLKLWFYFLSLPDRVFSTAVCLYFVREKVVLFPVEESNGSRGRIATVQLVFLLFSVFYR